MIPIDYVIQDGCWNCIYCFIKKDYESPREYYCNFDKSERPKCGSVLMDEWDMSLPQEQQFDCMHKWDEWAEEHEVSYAGKCKYWEKSND